MELMEEIIAIFSTRGGN